MSSETPTGVGGDQGPDVGEVVRFEVTEHGDGAVVVGVHGEIDTMTAPVLSERLAERIGSASLLVVDLTRVTFLGSAGLAALVEGKEKAENAGSRLRLVCGSHAVTRALEATNLMSLFDVADGVPEALRTA
ncbi:STAS domain-containing protein [Pseudonocardia alni]|jgi:anti-sigma B factor antagonist|uniref:Anti-sigma factor antagonist n=1 Tax=Pseudonocardia alni subsp. carboxydivorans TaxID=415010 RepID=A0ABU9AGL9_PSEA5|nr:MULTISPECIES: STAS domain-containing protein [Pseudonocardia]OJG04284.1 Anti-sigma-B factor antagonist [Pseudonocardia autotrophica]ALE80735.1 anti-sigma-factor antagonist [Pseudonocardia sp. AL041005-10]ALE82350.1 anti-sigma-factor antagonist [Pseudonocardia sp. HH130629-09]MCM3848180.1 STAS domain-containing protein [Pseudonocardia sp. DR1-2]MCO7197367.1 STAS domain-containing protein [Pseudonocardia sp. McavD-2-B]